VRGFSLRGAEPLNIIDWQEGDQGTLSLYLRGVSIFSVLSNS